MVEKLLAVFNLIINSATIVKSYDCDYLHRRFCFAENDLEMEINYYGETYVSCPEIFVRLPWSDVVTKKIHSDNDLKDFAKYIVELFESRDTRVMKYYLYRNIDDIFVLLKKGGK